MIIITQTAAIFTGKLARSWSTLYSDVNYYIYIYIVGEKKKILLSENIINMKNNYHKKEGEKKRYVYAKTVSSSLKLYKICVRYNIVYI